jgi:hypothetical protein
MLEIVVKFFYFFQTQDLKIWNSNHIVLKANSFDHLMNPLSWENRIYFGVYIFFIFMNWNIHRKMRLLICLFVFLTWFFSISHFFFILVFFIFVEIRVIWRRYFYNRVNQCIKIGFMFCWFVVEFLIYFIKCFGIEFFS